MRVIPGRKWYPLLHADRPRRPPERPLGHQVDGIWLLFFNHRGNTAAREERKTYFRIHWRRNGPELPRFDDDDLVPTRPLSTISFSRLWSLSNRHLLDLFLFLQELLTHMPGEEVIP